METTATLEEKTFPFIGRCTAKGCSVTMHVTMPSFLVTRYDYFNKPFKKAMPRLPYQIIGELFCATHKRRIEFKQVKGTFSPEHVCDARCLCAKGNNCECSCGGANHGKHYAISGL
jgi:hypothetical protein